MGYKPDLVAAEERVWIITRDHFVVLTILDLLNGFQGVGLWNIRALVVESEGTAEVRSGECLVEKASGKVSLTNHRGLRFAVVAKERRVELVVVLRGQPINAEVG